MCDEREENLRQMTASLEEGKRLLVELHEREAIKAAREYFTALAAWDSPPEGADAAAIERLFYDARQKHERLRDANAALEAMEGE